MHGLKEYIWFYKHKLLTETNELFHQVSEILYKQGIL